MNELANQLKTSQMSGDTQYISIAVAFIFCLISALILKWTYERKSNSLSSKFQFSNIFPILSLVTFLVILIVKSSLALSLGLVGALSIVRFRTPIKEPEDLLYLFLSISIGIGFGALQIIVTTFIFLSIIIVIWLVIGRKNGKLSNDYNLIIENKNYENYIKKQDELLSSIKKVSTTIEIIKIEKTTENSAYVMIKIFLDSPEQVKKLTEIFDNNFKDFSYSFYENQILH